MLELMRKHAGSWIIKIVLGAIALAFALSFGVYSYYGSAKEVALKVNDEPITMTQLREELARLTEQTRQQLGRQFDRLAPLLNLKQQAVNRLVDRVLLFQAARRMGVVVSPSEVAQRVAFYPAFQRNGRFDLDLYRRVLARSRLTPEQFEVMQQGQILMEKLSLLVAGAAQVSPLEVDQEIIRRLTRIKATYKLFPTDDFLRQQKASPEEIRAWYQKHRSRFLVPEKLVLRYITFPLARYRDQVEVRPEDIRDAYELDQARYAKPERVHARHILIKLPADAKPAEVAAAKEKAEKILALARKPGADFAALAKKYSQGPTAATGGDLGYFTRGQMVEPFEKLAFRLKPGEVGLVRTRFGWHVVKVEDHQQASITPLEEVRGEIRQRLVERQARDLAAAAAERAFDQVATGGLKALQDYARQHKLSLEQTEPLPLGQPIPGLPGLKGLAQAVEDMKPGQVLPVMQYDQGSVVAVLERIVPESVRPLKDVEEEVRLAVREEKARNAARQAAAALLDKLAKGKNPAAALAATPGAHTTDWLERGQGIPKLTGSARLVEALFLRPATHPLLEEPVEVGDAFAAAAVLARKPPSKEQIAEMRDKVRQQLLAAKRRRLVQRFLEDLRASAHIQRLVNL